MKIQPYMIHIDYDEAAALRSDNTLPVLRVSVGEAVGYDEDRSCWQTFNHFRGWVTDVGGAPIRRMLQIGVKLTDVEAGEQISVTLVTEDDSAEKPLDYDASSGFWFESSRFSRRGDEFVPLKGDWITGVVYAGSVNIVVKRRDGRLALKEKLVFLPSSISLEDYEAILSDLYRIREELVRRKQTNVSVEVQKERTLKRLQEIVVGLEAPLRSIMESPMVDLRFRWEMTREEKSGKFHPRNELARAMDPGKGKYPALAAYPTENIQEHRLIKRQLERLLSYCRFYQADSSIVQADRMTKRNEYHSILAKADQAVRASLLRSGGLDHLSSADFERVLHQLEAQLEHWDSEIEQVRRRIIGTISSVEDPPMEKDTVLVKINVRIRQPHFSKQVIWGRSGLLSIIKSGWEIEFVGYAYVYDGVWVRPRKHSRFVSIDNRSTDAMHHWLLLNAFQLGVLQIDEGGGEVDLEILGRMKVTAEDFFFADDDVVGVTRPNSSIRDYRFELTSVSRCAVNGAAIPLTQKERALEELSNMIMEIDESAIRLEEHKLQTEFNRKTVENIRRLGNGYTALLEDAAAYSALAERIDEWLSEPFFQRIAVLHNEPLVPTQVFLHDPHYQLIWTLLNELEEEIGLSLIAERPARRLGVRKADQLYEIWCYVKILSLLHNDLGWRLEDYDSVTAFIDAQLGADLPGSQKLTGLRASLTLDTWKIELWYEPVIRIVQEGGKTGKRTPDYVFRMYHEGVLIGNVYLDAKYKNYRDQGKREWLKDLVDVSIENYGAMRPVEWDGPTIASFIVHPDIDFGAAREMSGENYYAFYDRLQFPDRLEQGGQQEAHKYGSIYLLPSATHVFKNWFRMVMEYRVGRHFVCWSCGTMSDVGVEQRFTRGGYPKYYYTCPNCNEFWVKVHCTRSGHKIVKHANNYHRQPFADNPWFIVCPVCGDGFEKEDRER